MRISLKKITSFIAEHLSIIGKIVAFIILIIGILFLVVPQYQKARGLAGVDYTYKKTQLENETQYRDSLFELRNSLNKIPQEDIDRISLIIPKGKDIPGIFKQMEGFAKSVGMTLQSVSISDGGLATGSTASAAAGNASQVKTLSISVVLGGSMNYSRMKDFLNTLAKQAPILDLTSISYSPATSAVPTTYSFSFRSYYFQ
ncbi:MAG: hypothetical protein WCT08_02985 [Patescibacteria group bacterium]|jgi:Tfp pilus assembly protein PilO